MTAMMSNANHQKMIWVGRQFKTVTFVNLDEMSFRHFIRQIEYDITSNHGNLARNPG